MNFEDLTRRVASRSGLQLNNTRDTLKALGEVSAVALRAGDDVTIPGVGKLKPVQRAARKARNPITGAEVSVPTRRAVKFCPSSLLSL